MEIKFGPSGASESFYETGHKKSTEQPEWLTEHKLNAFEYSFGHGVRLSSKLAGELKEGMREKGITLSVHCPYYINMASDKEEQIEKNWEYLKKTVVTATEMGATRAVLHCGPSSSDRKKSFAQNKKNFVDIKKRLKSEGLTDVLVCPETMGKVSQLGDLSETLELCKVDDTTLPVIDFGHLNARTHGGLKTQEDFKQVIDAIENELGEDRAKIFHVHFSKIEYSKAGEVRHLTFEEDKQYGPDFLPFAKEIVRRNLTPTIICESRGTQVEDAVTMKKIYEKCKKS